MPARSKTLFLAGAILYMAVIFYASSLPGGIVGIPAPWDKLAHAASYGFLGWLWQRALGFPGWAWAIATLYGLSDEFHQRFVPGRMFDLADWLADGIGAAIGAWVGSRK